MRSEDGEETYPPVFSQKYQLSSVVTSPFVAFQSWGRLTIFNEAVGISPPVVAVGSADMIVAVK